MYCVPLGNYFKTAWYEVAKSPFFSLTFKIRGAYPQYSQVTHGGPTVRGETKRSIELIL